MQCDDFSAKEYLSKVTFIFQLSITCSFSFTDNRRKVWSNTKEDVQFFRTSWEASTYIKSYNTEEA